MRYAGLTQETAEPQALSGHWCSVCDHSHVLFLRVHTDPSQLFYPCLTPPSAEVLPPGGEFDPSIKEILWLTLLILLPGKHHGHAELQA